MGLPRRQLVRTIRITGAEQSAPSNPQKENPNVKKLATFTLAIFALASLAFGQVTLTSTTLSSAVAAGDSVINVTSATGITAPAGSPAQTTTLIFVDKELMRVAAVSSTSITVVRGESSKPVAHASGALLYAGDPSYFGTSDRSGACTSTSELVLPVVNYKNGRIYDCRSSGQWINILDGTMSNAAVGQIRASCTGTSGSAETEFLNGPACSGATTSTTRYVVSQYGTLANLRVSLSAAGTGGTNKDVLTVRKNGSDSALTVTTGTTACATGAAAACIDTTHSVAVAPGDVITFKWVSDTSDTAANVAAVVDVF